jgi:hypothetical protein
MSDKIRVKPEELEGRILEDIQKDLAATTVEEPSVVVPQVGLDVTSRDNPDSLSIEWDTDSSAPKIESSVVSDETDRLRRNVSKPAETISSQGYNRCYRLILQRSQSCCRQELKKSLTEFQLKKSQARLVSETPSIHHHVLRYFQAYLQ